MREDEVKLHSLTTRSGKELICIWFQFVIILLLRLGLQCVFFPYYTVSAILYLCSFHLYRDSAQFCAKRDGWDPCDKMADGWAKLCHQGRWRRNPEIALISVWKVSYWPWLGDVQIWMCSDMHQSLGLHAFKIFRQFRCREQ